MVSVSCCCEQQGFWQKEVYIFFKPLKSWEVERLGRAVASPTLLASMRALFRCLMWMMPLSCSNGSPSTFTKQSDNEYHRWSKDYERKTTHLHWQHAVDSNLQFIGLTQSLGWGQMDLDCTLQTQPSERYDGHHHNITKCKELLTATTSNSPSPWFGGWYLAWSRKRKHGVRMANETNNENA